MYAPKHARSKVPPACIARCPLRNRILLLVPLLHPNCRCCGAVRGVCHCARELHVRLICAAFLHGRSAVDHIFVRREGVLTHRVRVHGWGILETRAHAPCVPEYRKRTPIQHPRHATQHVNARATRTQDTHDVSDRHGTSAACSTTTLRANVRPRQANQTCSAVGQVS